MILYKFESAQYIAVTVDPNGGNLPSAHGPWWPLPAPGTNQLDFDATAPKRIGKSSQAVDKDIQQYGYCLVKKAGVTRRNAPKSPPRP